VSSETMVNALAVPLSSICTHSAKWKVNQCLRLPMSWELNTLCYLRSMFRLKQTKTFRTVDQKKGQSGVSYIWKYFEIFILVG